MRLAGMTSRNDYIDYSGETPEIGIVEREKLLLAVRQHRRDDVGVVNLPTGERVSLAKFDQLLPYGWAVLEHGETSQEQTCVGHCLA